MSCGRLAKSLLDGIPQRNKDLSFGYVRQYETRNKVIVPEMITYLALVHLNENDDEFVKNERHIHLKLNGDIVSINPTTQWIPEYESIILRNLVDHGLHIW